MPIALEPGGRWPVWLASDAEKPEHERPTFYFRALNGRTWKEASRAVDAIDSAPDGAAAIDVLFDAIRIGLVGWENMRDPATGETITFSPENLDLVVGGHEVTELAGLMLRVGITSKKKSDSEP